MAQQWRRRNLPPTNILPNTTNGSNQRPPALLPPPTKIADHLDLAHRLMRRIMHTHYFADLEQLITTDAYHPLQMLDIGCGTGLWCAEMATLFTEALITGVDRDPPHPPANLPSTCHFEYGDVLEGIPAIPAKTFAYTHLRFLLPYLPHDDWPHVIATCARVTKLGGWIEVVEDSVPVGTPSLDQWGMWLYAAADTYAIHLHDSAKLVQLFQRSHPLAGDGEIMQFGNVRQHYLTVPIGNYGGRAGHLTRAYVLSLIHAMRAGILGARICTSAAYDALAEKVPGELDTTTSAYITFWIIVAQRA